MDTSYSPEQEAFRDSLRRCLSEKYNQDFARQHCQAAVPHSEAMWNEFVALGISGLLIPESSGGLGMGMTDMGVVMEELGRFVNVAPVLSSCVGATSLAISFNDEEALTKLAGGSVTATIAFEEAGNNFLNHQQPGTQVSNGKLTGSKVWVADALAADIIYVTAIDGVYRVDAKATGISITPTQTIDASRRYARVDFHNVSAHRVGDLTALPAVIDRMLVALSADAVGAAEQIFHLALQYAKEREQFEVPVGSFQAVQHLLAEMFQQVEMAKAGLRYALWALDSADATEAHRAALIIKSFIGEKFPKLGADAIQVFGGAGFTWEYDVHLYYKRLLSAESLLGHTAVWLEELARIVID